jgi:alkylation response protein AidB-like acyl-CoA dehydrogenase
VDAAIIAAAQRVIAGEATEPRLRASRAGSLPDGWAALADAGLPLALAAEAAGGLGLAAETVLAIAAAHGAAGAPWPLAESIAANALLGLAGLPLAEGPATLALVDGTINDGRLVGHAEGTAWALPGVAIVAVSAGALALAGADAPCRPSLSGLARGDLSVDAPVAGRLAHDPQPLLAALRTAEIAGALATALAMTVEWTQTREQFGRPLARNQAVQHALAQLAAEAAAAEAAQGLAAIGLDHWLAGAHTHHIAAAKARASEAAGVAAAIAHQLHGAIGFTADHRLHLFTRALWQWRDDAGSEHHWQGELGRAALAGGVWALATA